MTTPATRVYAPKGAAAYLNLGRATVDRCLPDGTRQSIKVGRCRRFSQESLDAFVRAMEAHHDGASVA